MKTAAKSMPSTYDEVAYTGFPRAYTHPDRFFAIATVLGLKPAAVEECRVLEIGCGDGANLIAMAYPMPRAEFYGIDLSARHIERGRAVAEALRLTNLHLRCQDLMDVDPEAESFDYVIVHGLYSWSVEAVRDRILLLCRRCLNPHGVALVSYNTLPGGHLRRMLREMMLFHAREAAGPEQRVAKARELVELLGRCQGDPALYGAGIVKELARVHDMAEGSLIHDDLSDVYEPVYFRDFIGHAARHGLQFLAESDFHEMLVPPEVAETVRQWSQGDVLLDEQYLDFLLCRRFRATLLGHGGVTVDRELKPSRLSGLHLASGLRPAADSVDFGAEKVETFVGPKGEKVSIDLPLGKAALVELSLAFPRPIRFEELAELARKHTGRGCAETAATDTEVIGGLMLRLYSIGLLELYPTPARFTACVAERPVASALARWQAACSDTVSTLRHHNVKLEDEYSRALLRLLDGEHDRASLASEMSRLTGTPVSEETIQRKLEEVAHLALLEDARRFLRATSG